MPMVAGNSKCRVEGCQREPVSVNPGGASVAGEATYCAAHRGECFPLQEGFSLKDGFLQQNGVVVHNTHRGGTANRKGPGGGAGRGRGGCVAQRTSRTSMCRFPGCVKPATHGDGLTPTRCAAHKEKGQIDHKHRLCENVTPKPCVKQASFGWPGESKKRFCGAHRKPGTVDLRNCQHEGCGTRASHGFDKGRARFCMVHSLPGMTVLANKPCEKEGCTVSPRFGYKGEKPRFCSSHKEKQMINLKDRRCEHHACMTQPTFALPGEKPRFCSKHKSDGHVNVRHKLCRHANCRLVPTYGMKGTRVPVACLEHSDGDMVDLKRARICMSQAKKATSPAAASSSSSRGKLDASGVGKEAAAASPALASPAIAEGVGAGEETAPAAPAPTAPALPVEVEVVAGKKRPRAKATQGLGGNAGIGRKIAEAIFTSSQRVLDGEGAAVAAAMEESEWEEDQDEAETWNEGNVVDDDEEEADEVEAEVDEGDGRNGVLGQRLPVAAGAGTVVTNEVTAALVSPLLPAPTFPGQPLPGGTSLSWTCAACSKPIGADDRHVLVCCGYGLLHEACTTTFIDGAAPCPKCSRLVGSSLQVFV
eukprot:g11211.t1